MESNWDILLPAAYYELGVGFYFVQNVHYALINGHVHFWEEDDVEDDHFWVEDEVDDGPLRLNNGLERMFS